VVERPITVAFRNFQTSTSDTRWTLACILQSGDRPRWAYSGNVVLNPGGSDRAGCPM
jgi:hypothetical protein